MGRMPWAVYLWPGLPDIWRRGSWRGLAVAVGFAGLVNLGLVTSLVWTEIEPFTPPLRSAVWMVVAALWLGSAILNLARDRGQSERRRASDASGAFAQAVEQMLQRDWYEAQRTLERLLEADARDVDARLALATVLRHAGRWEEAAAQLDRLVLVESSRKWEQEIRRERALLASAERSGADESDSAAASAAVAA